VTPLEPYPHKQSELVLTKRLPRRAEARRRFMTVWLADKLEPGDRLVAGAEGIAGRPKAFEIAVGTAALVSIYPGWLSWASHASRLAHLGIFVLFEAAATMTLADVFTRKLAYVAITERRFMIVALDRRLHPVDVLADLPIDATSLTTKWRSVTLRAVDGSPLMVGSKARSRLRVHIRNRRAQRDDVLQAVAARGGMVNVPLVIGSSVPSGPA
jgi:hypothetical protein